MAHRELEWALRLRADLKARSDNLRLALTEIEPLRQELQRLEQQLTGVDRLIAVYRNHLGYQDPDLLASPDGEASPAPSLTPAEAGRELARFPRPGLRVLAITLKRDVASLAAMPGEAIARGYLGLRFWLIRRLRRQSPQA